MAVSQLLWQKMARHVNEREVEQGRMSRRIQMSALDKAPGPPGLPKRSAKIGLAEHPEKMLKKLFLRIFHISYYSSITTQKLFTQKP